MNLASSGASSASDSEALSSSRTQALAGIRVIDLSTPIAEATGRVLADLGAEVIKIEPPGGCGSRFVAPFLNGGSGGSASAAALSDGGSGGSASAAALSDGGSGGSASAAALSDGGSGGSASDPEGSLYWRMWGRGKRSVVLDLEQAADREKLLDLIRGAEILIESSTPGEMEALGLGYENLEKINPGLLYLSVTPFGQTGPFAKHPATDLTMAASGGLLNMQGDGDHPPIPVGFPETCHLGATQAAADVILALYARNRSGAGQHLDTSIQAAVLWTLMNITDYAALDQNPPGFGDDRTGRQSTMPIMPGLTLPVVEACKDGFVVMTLVLGAQGMFGFNAAMEWIGKQGGLDAELMEVDWTNWIGLLGEGKLSLELANRGVEQFLAHIRKMTKAEIQEQAVAQKWLIAPVNLAPDLLGDPQLRARNFWVDVDGSELPGPFARLSETPIAYDQPSPKLGQDQDLVAKSTQNLRVPLGPIAQKNESSAPRSQIFEGLKVADFSWIAAGPLITKDLANLGATVLRVETEKRIDTLRFIPPFVGDPGTTTGHVFANMNQSKFGIAIDFTTEKGLEVAHRMAEWADVVVENFTPGTAERIGLGYEQLRAINPNLVMLYTCMRGQTGPEAKHTGFGLHGAALGGFAGITGWPDGKPVAPWGAYTDFISPRFALAALGAALHHRDVTGQGQCIDVSQIEAAIHHLGPMILDYAENGRIVDRAGMDSERGCPHGSYRTSQKERFIAIETQTAKQWRALRSVVPELASIGGDELDALSARLAKRESIDQALAAFCATEDGFVLADRLREAGVPAYAVLRALDFHSDRQLVDRKFFIELEHAGFGRSTFDGPVTTFSKTPSAPTHAGPMIGEHTFEVMKKYLGYSDDEISDIAATGALS